MQTTEAITDEETENTESSTEKEDRLKSDVELWKRVEFLERYILSLEKTASPSAEPAIAGGTRTAASPEHRLDAPSGQGPSVHPKFDCGMARRSGIRKLLWILILCTGLSLTIIQANGLIQYFRSNPTAQNIRIETRSSVEFPEVTVCPGIAWNFTALKVLNETWITAYKSIWSGLFQKLLNISVLEALNSFTLTDFPKIVATCTIYPHPYKSSSCSPRHGWTWIDGSRVYETDAGYWRESPIVNWHGSDSPLKFCYTLHVKSELRMPLSSISPVMELGLSFKDSVNEFDHFNKFDKSGNPYYQIRIDSSQEPFTAVRNITLSGQIFFLLDGKSYMLSLCMKYYNFLPSGNKCNADENYDYKKCVETAIAERLMKKAPCVKSSVLPMKDDQAATMRQCNTSQDERDLINYYHGVQKHFDPGCKRKCKRTTYNAIQLDDPDFPYDPHYGVIKLNTPKAEVSYSP
ncbi:unnamed protein product [Darwinula stevensoni]|uniref:Uncharacterized protein n=1 Tax=Darwinula stevensoni TaxID=69355 RepID=A0A7R9ADR9_9CRUS|nr:unnamed protein product [Darwinula stevensoni]CAG0901577.1 unnamed protein product [Darwinula stevensoni]